MGKKVIDNSAPVMQKESKKTAKKVEAAPVEAAPVETAPVEKVLAPAEVSTTPEVTTTPEVSTTTEVTTASQIHGFLAAARDNAHQLSELARQQETRIRQLERMITKFEKEAGKRKRRVGGSGAKKGETPKGFKKEYLVSDSLCAFLGLDKGSQMTRLDIVSRVRQYANDNGLKDPRNGRIILPDAKLTKLFSVPKDEQLTIFNIQRYITPHVTAIVQAAPTTPAAPAAPTTPAPVVSEKKSKKSN
jgi:chromatin remodeling complex protein RSC6